MGFDRLALLQDISREISPEECPDGFRRDWDDKCVPVRQSRCPPGTVFNPKKNRCTRQLLVPTCPVGSDYDPLTGQCVQSVIEKCPYGTTLDVDTGRCVRGAFTRTCPYGTVKDPVSLRCLPAGPCPRGTIIDPVTRQCAYPNNKACPEGMTRDDITGLCEDITTEPCPNGTIRDEFTGKCEQPLIQKCPYGSRFDIFSEKCVSVGVGARAQACPYGATMDMMTGQCIQSVPLICPFGSQKDQTGQCTPLCDECNSPTMLSKVVKCMEAIDFFSCVSRIGISRTSYNQIVNSRAFDFLRNSSPVKRKSKALRNRYYVPGRRAHIRGDKQL